jgi:hypothetical protein
VRGRSPQERHRAAFCRRGVLLCLWLSFGVLGLWSAPARSQQAPRVLVLEPAEPNPREHELSTRLKGELGAAGFEVMSQSLPGDGDLRVAVVVQGSELGPVAAFAIASTANETEPGEQPAFGLQLWLSDRIEGAIILQAAEDGRGGAKAVSLLAVQGVELLQARVAASKLQTAAHPPEVDMTPPAAPPSEPDRRVRFRLAAGIGVFLEGSSGGTAPSPVLRMSSSWPLPVTEQHAVELGVRLTAAGFGKATVIQAPSLHIDVMQSLVLGEVVGASSADAPVRAFASLGGGAYRVEVEGVGAEQAVGRLQDAWSGILSAGAGISIHALSPWYLELESQGLFAMPATSVRMDSTSATLATFGRPLFLFSLGIGVSL